MKTRFFGTGASGLVLGAFAIMFTLGAHAHVHANNPIDSNPQLYRQIFSTSLTDADAVQPGTTPAGELALGLREDDNSIRYYLSVRNGWGVTSARLRCGTAGENGPIVARLRGPFVNSSPNGTVATGTLLPEDIIPNLNACSPGIQTMAHLTQALREGKIYAEVGSRNVSGEPLLGQPAAVAAVTPSLPAQALAKTTPSAAARATSPSVVTPPAQILGTHILLSDYFLSPPDSFTVTGARFWAGENVRITALGQSVTVKADQSGHFVTSAFVVPLAQANTSQAVVATGLSSGLSETATLKVGTYYPVVTPSAWYLKTGEPFVFRGVNFGPSEDVQILVNGVLKSTVRTDAKGALSQSMNASAEAGTHTYIFKGLTSKTSYNLELHVAK